MKPPADLQREARDYRERAQRTRRMAEGLSQVSDRERLNRYADELEKQAAELERQADALPAGAPPVVTQHQQQVQQQHATEWPDDDSKKQS